MSAPAAPTSAAALVAAAELAERRKDTQRMTAAMVRLLQITASETTGPSPSNPIANALKREGILLFYDDFIHLTAENIEGLHFDNGTEVVPLIRRDKLHLRSLLAFFHYQSHKDGERMSITRDMVPKFKEFRAKFYDPNDPITPWTLLMDKNDKLAEWTRKVKPNSQAFPTFRDITAWKEFKENTEITCDSQNMSHLIDPHHKVTDPDLDLAQRKFLYKTFRDRFLHHEAKRIVQAHAVDKDTRAIWSEVKGHYDSSITTSMAADSTLNFLTGVQLHSANWNKGQGEFLTHYALTVQRFNEQAPGSALNNDQSVRMLQNTISGTPNLAHVLVNYRQAMRAAGKSEEIRFDDFVALLSEPAQVYDNANNRTRGSLRRRANNHEIDVPEDGYEINNHEQDDDDSYPSYEEILEVNKSAQRDEKTGRYVKGKTGGYGNQKRLANYTQEQNGRTRAYMDRATWMSLSDEEKKAWDSISDKSRNAITTFHFEKGKEVALRDQSSNTHEMNEHQLVFEDDDEEDTKIEASVHVIKANNDNTPSKQKEPEPKKNNIDATKAMYENEGVSWDDVIMASKKNNRLEASMHMTALDEESDDEEGNTGIEINSHMLKGSVNDTYDDEEFDDEDLEEFDEDNLGEVEQELHLIGGQLIQESDLDDEGLEEFAEILETEETQPVVTSEATIINANDPTQVQPATYAEVILSTPVMKETTTTTEDNEQEVGFDDGDFFEDDEKQVTEPSKSEEEPIYFGPDWPNNNWCAKYMTIGGKKVLVESKDFFETHQIVGTVAKRDEEYYLDSVTGVDFGISLNDFDTRGFYGNENEDLEEFEEQDAKEENSPTKVVESNKKIISTAEEFDQEGLLEFADLEEPSSPKTPEKKSQVMTRTQYKEKGIEAPTLFPDALKQDDKVILKTSSSSPTRNPKNNPRNVSTTPMKDMIKATSLKHKKLVAEGRANSHETNMGGQFANVQKPMKTVDKIVQGEDGKFKLKSEDELKEDPEDLNEFAGTEDSTSLKTVELNKEKSHKQDKNTKESDPISDFHASALASATITPKTPTDNPKTPQNTSIDDGFTDVPPKKSRNNRGKRSKGNKKNNPCNTIMATPKRLIDQMMGRPTSPDQSASSLSEDSSNRFAALGDNEDDVTSDVIDENSTVEKPTLGTTLVPTNVEVHSRGTTLDHDEGQSTKSDPDASEVASSLLLLAGKSNEDDKSEQDFQKAGSQ